MKIKITMDARDSRNPLGQKTTTWTERRKKLGKPEPLYMGFPESAFHFFPFLQHTRGGCTKKAKVNKYIDAETTTDYLI